MTEIYAGIISYNPNVDKLRDNLDAITSQICQVVVLDNGSNNQKIVKELVAKYENVEIVSLGKNAGIAAALNQLMQWGYDRGKSWMLSLDQDSVCSDEFVKKMKPYLTVEMKLGIVAPVIVDQDIGIVGHNPDTAYAHVNTCITSGAFSNITAWKAIGGYDESMFIDSVDFEFCYRMRKSGYGVIQVKEVRLLHKLGESIEKRFLFWKVQIYGHSAFRKYYIARNNVYYPLKHHLCPHFLRGNLRNLWLMVVVVLYEKEKSKKLYSIIKGWRAAFVARRRA